MCVPGAAPAYTTVLSVLPYLVRNSISDMRSLRWPQCSTDLRSCLRLLYGLPAASRDRVRENGTLIGAEEDSKY